MVSAESVQRMSAVKVRKFYVCSKEHYWFSTTRSVAFLNYLTGLHTLPLLQIGLQIGASESRLNGTHSGAQSGAHRERV